MMINQIDNLGNTLEKTTCSRCGNTLFILSNYHSEIIRQLVEKGGLYTIDSDLCPYCEYVGDKDD